MTSSLTMNVLRMMEEITAAGPILPEYDGLRVFDHPDRVLHQLTGNTEQVAPVTLDLWPSLTCNARCPLCQYRVSGARDEVDQTGSLEIMSPHLAGAIFAGAVAIGVRSVILTGGGEPTLNPDLVPIARCARTSGLHWSLNTNAFTLDKALILALLAESPAYVKISIDAGTAASHSSTYNVPPTVYQQVIDHAIVAARAAAEFGKRNVGMSFSLGSNTTDDEVDQIRQAIEHLLVESNGGVGFVVFRARLLHYRVGIPVVPQPRNERFAQLADAIEDRVITPLAPAWQATRFDLKKGLFLLAARDVAPSECLSNSWMTTITQEGDGYATGELAGASWSGQRWGRLAQPDDFRALWYGPLRYTLHERIENGGIPLPIVHRTSPVDELFRRLRDIIGPNVSAQEATSIIAAVATATWYRSKNSTFV